MDNNDLLSKYYAIVPWKELFDIILGSDAELPFVNIVLWHYGIEENEYMISQRNEFTAPTDFLSFLLLKPPLSIHIGARFSAPVSSGTQQILYRSNLVLDYDTDSTRAGCNCKDKEICSICWKEVAIPDSQKIIRYLSHCGFKKVFAVFSGRRGIHIWIVDTVVRMLSNEERMKIVTNIESACGVKLDANVSSKSHSVKIPYSIHQNTLQASLPFNPFDETWNEMYPIFNINVFNSTLGVDDKFLLYRFPIKFIEVKQK